MSNRVRTTSPRATAIAAARAAVASARATRLTAEATARARETIDTMEWEQMIADSYLEQAAAAAAAGDLEKACQLTETASFVSTQVQRLAADPLVVAYREATATLKAARAAARETMQALDGCARLA